MIKVDGAIFDMQSKRIPIHYAGCIQLGGYVEMQLIICRCCIEHPYLGTACCTFNHESYSSRDERSHGQL